jgi:hypothetical protein
VPLDSPAREPMPRAERGRLGARKRWGPQRTVNLRDLDDTTANIIRTIIDARAHAAKAEAETAEKAS